MTLPADAAAPELQIELPRMLYAPVDADTVVGRLLWLSEEEVVAESPLVTSFGVEEKIVKWSFWNWLRGLFGGS